MIWRLAADLVLVLHGLFILFAVFGGLLVLWRRWLVWLHLPAMAWAALVVTLGWFCPLTPLEVRFREMAGDAGYPGGFIEHYLVPLIYPPGLTRGLQVVLGLLVVAINAVVYTLVLRRKGKRSR